ncbi:MAG: hypothetical protein HYT83_03710, partial [Candidatus Levybacteria bacterium]|nr:hypothetical protein [Candidatus Levybacteria bacterium]
DEDKFVFSPQEEVNIAARLLTDSDNPNDPNNGCIPTAKGITFFLNGTKVGTALACQTIRYKLPKEPNKYKILAQFDGDDQTGLIAASRETTITLSNKSTVPTEMLAHINGNHDAQVYANATYVNLGARFFVKGNSPDACIPTTISLKFWKVAGNKEENIPIDLHGDKASANCQSYKALLKGPGTYFFEAKYEENNKTVFLNASDTVKLVVAEIPQKSTITTFTIKPQPTNKQSRSGAGPQKAVAGISTTVLKPMLLAQATENKVIITISPCTVPSNDPNNNSAIDENVNVNIQDLESGKTFKGVFPNCQDSTIELDGFSPNDHLAGNACLPQNDSLEYEGSCSADAVVQVSTGNQTTPSITPEQESNNELHIQPENPGPYDNVTVTAYTSEIVSSPVFTITNNERTFQIQPEANDTNLSCQDKIGECTYSVNIPSPAGSYHISFKLDSGKEATFDFSTREEQDSQQETQATPTPENAVPTQEEQLTEEVAPTPIPQLTAATLFDIETGEEIPIPISGVLPLHLGGSPSENHEYKFLVKKYYSDNTTEEEPLVIQYEPKAEPAQYNNACEQEPQQPEESPVSIDEEPTPTEEPQPILCIYEEYPRNCPNGGTRKCKGSNEGEGCHYNPEINPDCEEECNQETEPTTPQTNDKYSWYCNESVIIEKTPTGEENVFQDCADIEQQCEEFYNYDYGADDAMCVTP